jgi:hypothetical protein
VLRKHRPEAVGAPRIGYVQTKLVYLCVAGVGQRCLQQSMRAKTVS